MTGIAGRIRTSLPDIARTSARDVLVALIAVPMLLLLSLVVLEYGTDLVDGLGKSGLFSPIALAASMALGVGLLFVLVVRKETPYPWQFFLPASLVVAAILYGTYVSSIQVDWVSDFGGMWRYAVEMVQGGDYSVQHIYHERSLPVLVPLIELFGPHKWLVPAVNVCMLLAIQLAGYDLLRRIAGHRAAQGFVVLWVGAMEPVMALPITSHDIWGLFYLVAFLWGFRALNDRLEASGSSKMRYSAWFGAGVLVLAGVLTLLDMQRELAPFVGLGLLIAGAVLAVRRNGDKPRLRTELTVVASILVAFIALSTATKAAGYMLTSEQGKGLAEIRMGAYGSSLANGRYVQGQLIADAFFRPLDQQTRTDLVRSIPLSDLALQGWKRGGNVVYRALGQARLGSQYFFYHSNAKARWGWMVPLARLYNTCYSLVLAAIGLWLVLPVLRRAASIDGLAQLAFLSTLAGALLLVGESQPRYIFPVWFVIPQVAALALASRPALVARPVPVAGAWGWDVTRGIVLLCAAFLLFSLCFRLAYDESAGRILSGWKPGNEGGQPAPASDWFQDNQHLSAQSIREESKDTRQSGFGELALVLKFPGLADAGAATFASRRICIESDRDALDFFYFMPYQNPRARNAFTLEVMVDGQRRWQASLPGTTAPVHVRISRILPHGGCGELKFRLIANKALQRESWTRASQVDVYFPRLVR